MKKILFILLFTAVLTISGFSQVIKIGTMAPQGSLWETTLKEIAAEWSVISNGRIEAKIYTGGSIGNEEDIIRKMKLGRLQAAALTSQGMGNINPDLVSLSLPMKISDDDEFDYVFRKIIPSFNKTLEREGFTALGWTMSGWVKWFTTKPVSTPDDLRRIKMAVDNSDDKVIQIWKKVGFKVIPLALPDLMSGLYSGMAEGTYITPYAAAAIGMAELTPYMYDMPVSPLYAGLFLSSKTWKRIPDEYKDEMIKRTAVILEDFYDKMKKIEDEAIQVMKGQGLIITPQTPANTALWEETVSSGVDLYVEEMLSNGINSEMNSYIDEYRNKKN